MVIYIVFFIDVVVIVSGAGISISVPAFFVRADMLGSVVVNDELVVVFLHTVVAVGFDVIIVTLLPRFYVL